MSPLRFFSVFEASVEEGLEDEGEEVFAEHSASGSGGDFDEVIGAIEDIVVDDRFQDIQHNLMEKYSHHFEVNRGRVQIEKKNCENSRTSFTPKWPIYQFFLWTPLKNIWSLQKF